MFELQLTPKVTSYSKNGAILLEHKLSQEFKMKNLEGLKSFLRIEVS
jgi:hypothetical protein